MDPSPAEAGAFLGGLDDARRIMFRLVEDALEEVDADRCTLTSIDQSVMRVEASRERGGGVPSFIGAEYPLSALDGQPLLREAVTTGHIVTGPGFGASGTLDGDVLGEVAAMHRVAVVPLVDAGRTPALLILSRSDEREFNRGELRSLQRFGTMALLALRNSRLLEQVETAQRRGLDVLTRISQLVAVSDDRVTFFEKLSEMVAELVSAEHAAFWMLIDGQLVAQPAHAFSPDQLAAMRLGVGALPGHPLHPALFEGRAVRFEAGQFSRDDPWRELLEVMHVSNGLAVPWRTAREPIGVLTAFNASGGEWSAQTEWMLRLSARSSALVWQGYEAERRVAELRAAEVDRLAEHAARVASLDEQKSEFLRLASHELRTPITVVRGYLSMLEEGALGPLPAEAARVLPVMSGRTSQIGALVEQMLAASRAQDSGFVPLLEEVELGDLVRAVLAELNGTAEAHRVRMEVAGETVAMADVEKTKTIVTNLLSNAIKYSPAGGDIDVSIDGDGGTVSVAVRDVGIGISQGDVDKLFRPFGRVDTDETRCIQGTGLGLYLSRRLARLQGGDVTVESQLGAGSTFTLLLPGAVAG